MLALSLALMMSAWTASAQTGQSTALAPSSTSAPLNLLPPSDLVAFVNVNRLINDAAPKVMADNPAKLAEFNAALDKLKMQTGLDARSFSSVALGLRYQHPTPGITTADTVAIISGTFNASALVAAGRLASKG